MTLFQIESVLLLSLAEEALLGGIVDLMTSTFCNQKFYIIRRKKRTKDISFFWKLQFPMLSRIRYNTLIYKN